MMSTEQDATPGTPTERIALKKYGSQGGICYRWNLEDGDYIRVIEFTSATMFNNIQALKFVTDQGEVKIIGPSLFGITESKKFNRFKLFAGFWGLVGTAE